MVVFRNIHEKVILAQCFHSKSLTTPCPLEYRVRRAERTFLRCLAGGSKHPMSAYILGEYLGLHSHLQSPWTVTAAALIFLGGWLGSWAFLLGHLYWCREIQINASNPFHTYSKADQGQAKFGDEE